VRIGDPAEVEGRLNQHFEVSDGAIIGVPDPEWTQNVKAIVVLEPGQSAMAEELIEHCRTRIASLQGESSHSTRGASPPDDVPEVPHPSK
jgi:long-chain acyl-CoA synthetase